jgi:hypothetical protein
MNYRLLFLPVAAALLLPAEAPAQLVSGYRYEHALVGPGGGMAVGQRSGGVVAGPLGASSWGSRSGSYVAPSGATVEYAQRSGAVVGPLGGGWAGSSSYVHAESADRGLTYSRYSSRSTAVGPVGGLAAGRAMAAAVGPFAAPDYLLPGEALAQPVSGFHSERTVVGPDGGVFAEQRTGGVVAGPFGATSGMTRSGSYVAPSGATVEFNERSGAVVGPLGGGWAGSSSYVHAESADRGLTYSRYSSRSTAIGPFGGPAVGPSPAGVGPFGPLGYRRAGGVIWP